MDKIPFLLLGDGPHEPTGLGRIARDLAAQIHTSDLPVSLLQVGGTVPPVWQAWPHVPLDRAEDWGAANVQQIYQSIWGDRPGILFAIWDPARLFTYGDLQIPVQKWAYCAIDGENVNAGFGGPARAGLETFDRILAYGRYGNRVLNNALGRESGQWLPHGISTHTYQVSERDEEAARFALGPHAIGKTILGCVMANQPRKDFGILFHTLKLLRERKLPVYLWLHTDELVKAWAVQQLVEDFGLQKLVTVTTEALSDQQMAGLYAACTVTLLPSLGEGFGYPIAESLAAGTPCVHTDCAEGANLVPKTEWRVPVRNWRLDSVYAIRRPVTRAEDWANAVERCLRWQTDVGPAVTKEYCQGAVAHLDWERIWPRWYAWFKQGLQ
jgi:glycosyltransferase involved in cell wall biosynthesis